MAIINRPFGYIPVCRSRNGQGALFMGRDLRWYHATACSGDVKIYRKKGALVRQMRRQGIHSYGWIAVNEGDVVDRTGTVHRPSGSFTTPANVL